ncbi:MAG: fructosamine kinase family protein [Eubacteriales bacterium]
MNILSEGTYNADIESSVTAKTGKTFRISEIRENKTGAMHDAAIFKGEGLDVFVKIGKNSFSHEQFDVEAYELDYLREHTSVRTPHVIDVVHRGDSALLILEALCDVKPESKSDWEILGRGLAEIHRTHSNKCGFDRPTFLGIFKQDNTWKTSWSEFYGECRLFDTMKMAVDAGHMKPEECAVIEKLAGRLPEICPPQNEFSLLHGDAWLGNLMFDGKELVAIDCSLYYGNREIDLTNVDFFCPVPQTFFDAYNEAYPIEYGFEERRDLWKINQWLGHVALFGEKYIQKVMDCAKKYL